MLRLDDGSIAEGVVDLAYPDHEPGFAGWTVVDFKTDREFAAASDRYFTQVRLYAEAIGSLMHVPTQGVPASGLDALRSEKTSFAPRLRPCGGPSCNRPNSGDSKMPTGD